MKHIIPGNSAAKEYACKAGDPGSIPKSGRSPGVGRGYPLQHSCLENPHGQKSLTDYSPWSPNGSDTTERLNTHMKQNDFPTANNWK